VRRCRGGIGRHSARAESHEHGAHRGWQKLPDKVFREEQRRKRSHTSCGACSMQRLRGAKGTEPHRKLLRQATKQRRQREICCDLRRRE
ncbi:unnamed protein product, partial [Symbiodinium pilosum]